MVSDTTGPVPTVSVVIGAYNAERWIAATIESVLGQTWDDFEVIIIDDGSTDATAKVARGFGEAVQLVQKENGGPASARNAGINAARGRYVAFLDADDLWLPHKLERQMALFRRLPDAAWSYTDAYFFDAETGATLRQAGRQHALPEGDVLEELLMHNFIPFSSAVVRCDVFDAVGFFDTSPLHRISEDWDLWLRVAERYPVAVAREPLVRMRRHGGEKTETMDLEHALESRQRLVARAVARNPERLAGVHGRAVANLCLPMGRKYLEREERAAARRVLGYGLRRAPTALACWLFWIATFLPPSARRLLGRLRARYRRMHLDS